MDLIAPLFRQGFFGLDTSMVVAFVIGFLFGTSLEKAGFGNGRKLTAQFYLHDMAVYKVMFTAVVTSMFLVQLAVLLGLMSFEQVFVPPTYVWPQIVGGLLLGVGFVVGGYCPGTSVVSVASGKLDGMVYVLGFFAGLAVFPYLFDAIGGFYSAGAMGVVTLFDYVPVPPLLLAGAFVVVAIVSFFGVVRLERWVSTRWPSLRY
ncbi:MAG TPA: DUF6691 family protein [bacterium]|nr:DUF6691 family protein [bacterium]